jgi:hypothetical protein
MKIESKAYEVLEDLMDGTNRLEKLYSAVTSRPDSPWINKPERFADWVGAKLLEAMEEELGQIEQRLMTDEVLRAMVDKS